jgi:hypothetical protein
MLIPVTSVGWRLPGSEEAFARTRALSDQSHLEFNWYEGASGETLTEVWVDLFVTESEPIRKWTMYRMDAQDLEWQFELKGPYEPLTIAMEWNRVDEEAGEITLLNRGVPRNLLAEIGAEAEV